MHKLFKMPFSVDHLCNNQWKPDNQKSRYTSQENYEEAVKNYEDAQKKVMFKNIYVQFESCDCGGEYGCSHAAFPFKIIFENNKEDVEALFEDDGFYLQNENGFVKFENEKGVTMGKFITACWLIGIKLELTEYGKTLCDGFYFF